MDEMDREMLRGDVRDTRGDLGGNDTAVIAEYDIATEERRHGERRAGTERATSETGGRPWTMVAGRAEGRNVDVRGAVGMTRADQANVSGFSGLTVGGKTKLTGGTPLAIASDEVEIERGGSLLAVAGKKVEIEDHGYLGIAIAPRVEVEKGGTVLITALAALVAGLTFGIGFGAVVLMGIASMRRRGIMGRMRARRMMQTGVLGDVTRGADRVNESLRAARQR